MSFLPPFVTPIRDPFITPNLVGKVTFFLNFFSKNHLPLLPLKGHKNADFLPRYSVADGQRILDPSVLTHTIHGTRKYIYRHIDLTKIKHSCIGKYTIFPWIVWVMSLGFKWSCWIIDVSIVPFGSGKTLGFFKGRFTRFWCCLLIYIYIYMIYIYSGVKKVHGYQSAFFPFPGGYFCYYISRDSNILCHWVISTTYELGYFLGLLTINPKFPCGTSQ